MNEPELAELAANNDLAHQAHGRIEGVGVADDQVDLVALSRGDDGVAFRERERHRLFQNDVLAMLGRERGMLRVELVRRCDIDHLNSLIADQHPHVLVRTGRFMVAGECLARPRMRIGAGGEHEVRVGGGGMHHYSARHAETGYAEADRL